MKVIPDKSHEYHYSPYPPPPPPPAGGLASGSSSPNSFAPPPVSRKGSKKDKVQRQQSPPNEDATTYKVARAISSCTRCRQRKQKCDGKLPACTACDRAKVECIGFDAISKTNVSRNYLHSLEQEVATLRAQIAAMSQNTDDNGASMVKREIAERASEAVQTFSRPHPESGFARPSDLLIDPSLQNETGESSLRSPWDSPGFAGQFPHRRHSEFAFSSSGFDSPRSPYTPGHSTSASRTQMMGQQSGIGASSLTRLVHDAAFKTGHAQNAYTQLHALGANQTGSEKGSDYSAADTPQLDSVVPSPQDPPAGKSGQATSASTSAPSNAHFRPPTSSPLATAASVSSGKSSSAKRRHFSVPPLPPQPAVERLVAAYVDFVGVTAPIIHIPSLGKQLIKIRENRDVEQSDIFVVMMVLALSTMASSRFVDPPDELRACSEAFHAEAMKHMDAVFEEQSYVGLQAILLLVWYSLLNPDKGSIWFLIGLATRTCVDLGFHNEHNIDITHFDALELDMRRRLFWVTYKMDRLLSQALGRPPSIPDGYISVPLPSSLHDVDIHSNDFGPLTGEPCSYKAVFLHTTKLRQLQSEILDCTYGLHRPDGTLNVPPPEWFDDCFERLKEWLATSPEPRGTVSSEGYAISFHNSALLLFRPSLGCERPGRKALSTVLASSSYVIRIYRRMQLNNRISWLWMTSHWSFMAGLSFLYAFFNLYTIGGVPGVPTLEEAMADIESCMAVLEYLAPRVPSAGACHDTMQTLSKAIMEQLQSISSTTSPGGRGALRSAPISSSRDDPLPNESFPAPLPAIALPYELSLLDNLFVNPMAQHNKASDYTNGNKCKKNGKKDEQDGNNASSGAYGSSSNGAYGGSHGSRGDRSMGPPQGFPPNAFGGNTLPGSASTAGGNTIGLQAYGMAAQMGNGKSSGTIAPHGAFSPSTMGLGDSSTRNGTPQSYGYDSSKAGQGQSDTSALDDLAAAANGSMAMTSDGQAAGTAGAGASGAFDMFSFLMDEEGGLAGSGNWDALDIPSDFGLWS